MYMSNRGICSLISAVLLMLPCSPKRCLIRRHHHSRADTIVQNISRQTDNWMAANRTVYGMTINLRRTSRRMASNCELTRISF